MRNQQTMRKYIGKLFSVLRFAIIPTESTPVRIHANFMFHFSCFSVSVLNQPLLSRIAI